MVDWLGGFLNLSSFIVRGVVRWFTTVLLALIWSATGDTTMGP